MKRLEKNKPSELSVQQLWVNRLAICFLASAGGGFVLAIYLGAFANAELKEVASWVTALAAVASVMVAVVVVMYVAQTLKATRQTLDATRDMAREQTRIGDSQIRPYIVFESLSNETPAGRIGSVSIVFKNVGVTPAASIEFASLVEVAPRLKLTKTIPFGMRTNMNIAWMQDIALH